MEWQNELASRAGKTLVISGAPLLHSPAGPSLAACSPDAGVWLAVAGSGWLWPALAGSGWLWLALAGCGCRELAGGSSKQKVRF